MRRAGIAVVLTAVTITGLAHPAAASPRTKTTVHDFHTFAVIDGASAGLTRTARGLSATLRTSLPAGHAETMWWVVFNNPSGCTGGCGADEVETAFGGPNPAQVSVVNADGRVVPAAGGVSFAAQLSVGSDGPGENLIPGGVTNPLGALVLLVIVDHGPAASDRETRYAQTHALTWAGACPNQTADNPIGDCMDAHIAVFPPS